MAKTLGLSKSGQHFTNYFILVPKKLQKRLLNTLHTIKLKVDSSHCILAYDEVINSIYIDPRHSIENIELFASVKCSFFDIFFTDI